MHEKWQAPSMASQRIVVPEAERKNWSLAICDPSSVFGKNFRPVIVKSLGVVSWCCFEFGSHWMD